MSLPKVKAKDPKLNKTIHCISNELLTSPLPVYKKGLVAGGRKGPIKKDVVFGKA